MAIYRVKKTSFTRPKRTYRKRVAKKTPMRKRTAAKPTRVFKKKVTRIINSMAESKYNHVTHQELNRIVMQRATAPMTNYTINNQLSALGFCFTDANNGATPTSPTTDLNLWVLPHLKRFIPLNMDACFTRNSLSHPKNAIEGSYISPNMAKCTFTIEVPQSSWTLDQQARSHGNPQKFRMIVIQPREGTNTPNADEFGPYTIVDKLFLDQFGEIEGIVNNAQPEGLNAANLMTQPINKRLFRVIKDTSFTLQTSQRESQLTSGPAPNEGINYTPTQNYPAQKQITVRFPTAKKAYYGPDPASEATNDRIYPVVNRKQYFVLFLQCGLPVFSYQTDQFEESYNEFAHISARPIATFKDI